MPESNWFTDWLSNIGHGFVDWSGNVQDGWSNFVDYMKDAFTDMGDKMSNTVAQQTGIDFPGEDYIPNDGVDGLSDPAIGANTTEDGVTAIDNAISSSPSISKYMSENPDMSPEDYMKYMAQNSDEWAEKLIDYYLEKQSIEEANAYTASREDTAYQRLVADLKNAGLNPAMMYGSSASPQASGSAGVVKASEGANARTLSNYDKMKRLVLAYLVYRINSLEKSSNMASNWLGSLVKAIF